MEPKAKIIMYLLVNNLTNCHKSDVITFQLPKKIIGCGHTLLLLAVVVGMQPKSCSNKVPLVTPNFNNSWDYNNNNRYVFSKLLHCCCRVSQNQNLVMLK